MAGGLGSDYATEIAERLFKRAQTSVAVGATGAVVDLRGMAGFVVFLSTGTATWQPCAADGTVVTGSSTTAVTSGLRVDAPWTHVKIVAAVAAAIVSAV